MRPALAVVVAGVALALFAEGATLPTAWLPLEEAAVLGPARGLSLEAPSAGVLHQVVVLPVTHVGDTREGFRMAQGLSALLWALAVVPSFLLARRLAPPAAALGAAVLAVLVPGSLYATAAVPDALAFLLGVAALALASRAVERASRADLAGACSLGAGAALARPWLVVLPFGILAGYELARTGRLDSLRWPRTLAPAVAAALTYAVLARFWPETAVALASPGAVLRAAAASLVVAVVGAGVLPALLAPAALRPERGLLLACLPPLALVAGVLGVAPPGRGADERPLLVLTPLVFALGLAAFRESSRAVRIGVAAAAGVVLGALLLPPFDSVARQRALGFGLVSPNGGSRALVIVGVWIAAGAGLLLLVVLRRRPRLLAAGVASLVLVGHAGAWSAVREEARTLAASSPGPQGWVDVAAGPGKQVVVTGPAEALDQVAVAQLTVWNRSVRGAQALSFLEVDLNSGQLGPTPDADLLLVRGTELAGTEVARAAGGVLLRPELPLHLAETVQGVFPDGWSGARAAYRRFSGAAGTVVVTLLRADGPSAEATVEVPGRVVRVDLPTGEERRVELQVPRPYFELVVVITPTFAAADGRALGARVRFEYRPER